MPNSFPEKTGKKRKAQSAIFLNVRNPLPLFLVYANREGRRMNKKNVERSPGLLAALRIDEPLMGLLFASLSSLLYVALDVLRKLLGQRMAALPVAIGINLGALP